VRNEEGAIEEILGAFEMRMHHLVKWDFNQNFLWISDIVGD
jgi:hypothetical protein